MPQAALSEIARLEASARRSATFRRLLAETDSVPRGAARLPDPAFLAYEPPPRERLAFDPARLERATEWDFQLAETRELARASMGLPVPVLEAELSAAQQELAALLELAAGDAAFSKAMAARVSAASALLRSKPGEAVAWRPKEAERAALLAALLAQSPDRFYAEGARALALPDDTVRLPELEDFVALHGAGLDRLAVPEGQPFVKLGEARYPAALVAAAKALIPLGGAARLREAIGPREERARALSTRLRRWLK